MKKISEHLGEIIVALACVALLISAITIFDAPVSGFFNSIVEKEVALGNELLQGIENIDTSVGVGGSGSGGENGGGAGGENGDQAGDEGLTAEDLDCLYDYGFAVSGDVEEHHISLSTDFKAALNNNTDYVVDGKTLWTAGSALPNYELDDEEMPEITSLSVMFKNCSMTTLDLSNWDISNVTNTAGMFEGCDNLSSIIVRTAADKAVIEACNTLPGGCTVTVK